MFAVWLLSYLALPLVMACFWHSSRSTGGTEFARLVADLAIVHTTVTVVFAIATTFGVRAITSRQAAPRSDTPTSHSERLPSGHFTRTQDSSICLVTR